jgi:hypothetical protein
VIPSTRDAFADDAIELRLHVCVLGDERSSPLAGDDEPLALQARVRGARGVHIHATEPRELAHAGELLAGGECPRLDERSQPPGDLHTDRQLFVAVDRSVEFQHREKLCHYASTVARSK